MLRSHLRRCLSGFILLTLLYAQVAVAGYACPMEPDVENRPAANAWDETQGALCLQHCQYGNTQQPADLGAALTTTATAPLLLYPLTIVATKSTVAATWDEHARHRERAPPLPHALLHCCLRT